jgi:hypothetical protein
MHRSRSLLDVARHDGCLPRPRSRKLKDVFCTPVTCCAVDIRIGRLTNIGIDNDDTVSMLEIRRGATMVSGAHDWPYVVDCCRSDNMLDAFAMLLASASAD